MAGGEWEVKDRNISLKVNGEIYTLRLPDNRTLLQAIRDDLGLTGTKEGCGVGECGACTVLVSGRPLPSCLVLAVEMDGKEITTIEGLAQNGVLDPLQQSFIEEGAVQCGFCTPGMLMSAKGLLNVNPDPTEGEIRRAIEGNLCRCTGYGAIIKAIKKAVVPFNIRSKE
jgi:aerobic-type carbon monoxide dehydrogenase small subunit (CoxS/CutS family)